MKRFLFASLGLALLASVTVQPAFASHRTRRFRTGARLNQAAKPPQPRPAAPLNLAGQVVLSNGAPATGATVYLVWNTQNGTVPFVKVPVDSAGRFKQTKKLSNAVIGSTVEITAYIPDRGWSAFQAALGSKQLSHLRLKLQPGVTLTGRLFRSSGSPAANTALEVETLFPGGGAGGMGIGQAVFTGPSGSSNAPLMPYDNMIRLLPDGAAPGLFHTRTDAQGRFTLTGVPRQTSVLLRPQKDLILTPNSMAPLTLSARLRQDVGALVVTKTGSARIQVLDTRTHKPQPGVVVVLAPRHAVFTGPIFYHSQPPFNTAGTTVTDQNGLVEAKNLLPGSYTAAVMGSVQEIRVDEGKAAARAEFALRQGPLEGRLLDPAGKPIADVDIVMNSSSGATPGIVHSGTQEFGRNIADFDGRGTVSGWEKSPVARTNADGSFSVPQFPWGSRNVIVRATRNNDRAEFIGPVSGIGAKLELRMRPNALISVSGRLIDPHRRAVTQLNCQALHWQRSLRPAWFASAHEVRADANGRFRIDGLERGESFSVISSGQQFQQQQVRRSFGSAPGFTTVSAVNNFESPRFVTSRDAVKQDLGDVMVHPSTTPEEVLQSYGAAQRQIVNAGVMEAPAAPAAAQAQVALKRYQRALHAGDLRTVHLLTSHLSPGYSESLPEFLKQAALSGLAAAATEERMDVLRFVPRSLILGLTMPSNSSPMIETISNRLKSESQLDIRDDLIPVDTRAASLQSTGFSAAGTGQAEEREWVVLTAKRQNNIMGAAMLHHEDGQWRVVSNGVTANMPLVVLFGAFGGLPPQLSDLSRKAAVLPIEKYAAAREAGERYLRLWAENRPAAMLKATSSHSLSFAKNLTDYLKVQESRPDEGICPLPSSGKAVLQPLVNLSLWDQKWLAQQARLRGMSTRLFNGNAFAGETGSNLFPDGFLKRGDLALLEYSTPSGRFLMALLHEKGGWKVLEQAMPL